VTETRDYIPDMIVILVILIGLVATTSVDAGAPWGDPDP